jgi:hypothetical protein
MSHESTAMKINKQFAQDGTGLDDCMDPLLEVLAQLLSEQTDAAAGDAKDQGKREAPADLRSGGERAIHVVVTNPKK